MSTDDGGGAPPRRQRLSADERRAQIVRAVTEVVAVEGYTNASLTAVASRAGVAKGLIWHYFEDREDLMRQAAEDLAAQLRAALVADLDLTAPVPDVIRMVFARTAQFTRTHSAELAAIDQIVHNLRARDGQQRLTMLDYENIYADHEALLRRGQIEGSIRPASIRAMASAYQGLIGSTIGYLQAHPDVEPAEYATHIADLFLDGAAMPRSG